MQTLLATPAWHGSRVADLAEIAAAFGYALHAAGVPVTPERSTRFAAAVALIEPSDLDRLYWIGRVALLTEHAQIETYDRVFRHIFQGMVDFAEYRGQSENPAPKSSAPTGERSPGDPERSGESDTNPRGTSATPGERSNTDDDSDDDEPSALAAVSTTERLRDSNFQAVTEEELALIARLVEQLPLVPPRRLGRRHRRHARGRKLDVRATLRRAHRTGGDPIRLRYRKRTPKPRRIVLIADVSGSMEPYARIYLHLMRGAVTSINAESFVFATRLTRITRQLSKMRPELAYQAAHDAAKDWNGGTSIGRALTSFVNEFGRRGLARGSVIVIVSDGWEIEDPALIANSMEQISRLAHHVIWVNPRKAAVDYQPLVGGMNAALPFVDTFVSGHSVNALEEVMAAIARAGDRT